MGKMTMKFNHLFLLTCLVVVLAGCATPKNVVDARL